MPSGLRPSRVGGENEPVPSLGATAHVCEEGVGGVAETATPNPTGSDRSHRISKMGSEQARGLQGEGIGARDKRMQGDWSPLKV